MYVCMFVSVHIYTHIHTHIYMYTCGIFPCCFAFILSHASHTGTSTYKCTRTYTYIYTHTYTQHNSFISVMTSNHRNPNAFWTHQFKTDASRKDQQEEETLQINAVDALRPLHRGMNAVRGTPFLQSKEDVILDMFEAMDVDHTGELTAVGVFRGMRWLGCKISEFEAQRMVELAGIPLDFPRFRRMILSSRFVSQLLPSHAMPNKVFFFIYVYIYIYIYIYWFFFVCRT
jgi:hypothetical protein